MSTVPELYVPALKWRQGEYQALLRLKDKAKTRIKPFIMIPALEFDFEDNSPKKLRMITLNRLRVAIATSGTLAPLGLMWMQAFAQLA